jgi:hypothetical protein
MLPCDEHLPRKVNVRLPGKENSNAHGARPVHLISTKVNWIRASRLSIKSSLLGSTKGSLWEYHRLVLGAVTLFLESFVNFHRKVPWFPKKSSNIDC